MYSKDVKPAGTPQAWLGRGPTSASQRSSVRLEWPRQRSRQAWALPLPGITPCTATVLENELQHAGYHQQANQEDDADDP